MFMTTLKAFIINSGRSPLSRECHTGLCREVLPGAFFKTIRETGENQYLPNHGRYVFFELFVNRRNPVKERDYDLYSNATISVIYTAKFLKIPLFVK